MGGGHVDRIAGFGIVSDALGEAAESRCPGDYWLTGAISESVPRS